MPARAASSKRRPTRCVAPNDQRCAIADGDLATAHLAGGAEDALVLVVAEADPGDAVEHGGDRRDRPARRGRRRGSGSRASRLCGLGRPRFEKIVDSSATTARPSRRACATSSCTRIVGTTDLRARRRATGARVTPADARRRRSVRIILARRHGEQVPGGERVAGSGGVDDVLDRGTGIGRRLAVGRDHERGPRAGLHDRAPGARRRRRSWRPSAFDSADCRRRPAVGAAR